MPQLSIGEISDLWNEQTKRNDLTESWITFIIELLGQSKWAETRLNTITLAGRKAQVKKNLVLYETETNEQKTQTLTTLTHIIKLLHAIYTKSYFESLTIRDGGAAAGADREIESTTWVVESPRARGGGAAAGATAAEAESATSEHPTITQFKRTLISFLQKTCFIPIISSSDDSEIMRPQNRISIDNTHALIIIDTLVLWYNAYTSFFPGERDTPSETFRILLPQLSQASLNQRNKFINDLSKMTYFATPPRTATEASFKARLFEALILNSIRIIQTNLDTETSTDDPITKITNDITEAKRQAQELNNLMSSLSEKAQATITQWLSTYDPIHEVLLDFLKRKANLITVTVIPATTTEAEHLAILSEALKGAAEKITPPPALNSTALETLLTLHAAANTERTALVSELTRVRATSATRTLFADSTKGALTTPLLLSEGAPASPKPQDSRTKLQTELSMLSEDSTASDLSPYLQLVRLLSAHALLELRDTLPPKEASLLGKAALQYAHSNLKSLTSLTDASTNGLPLLPTPLSPNPLLEELEIWITNLKNQPLTDSRVSTLLQKLALNIEEILFLQRKATHNFSTIAAITARHLAFPATTPASKQREAYLRILSLYYKKDLDDHTAFMSPYSTTNTTFEEAYNTAAAYLANPMPAKIFFELIKTLLQQKLLDFGATLTAPTPEYSEFEKQILTAIAKMFPHIIRTTPLRPPVDDPSLHFIATSFARSAGKLTHTTPKITASTLLPPYETVVMWQRIISGENPWPRTFKEAADILIAPIKTSIDPSNNLTILKAFLEFLAAHPQLLLIKITTPPTASAPATISTASETPPATPRTQLAIAKPGEASERVRTQRVKEITIQYIDQLKEYLRKQEAPCSWQNIKYKLSPWLILGIVAAITTLFSVRIDLAPEGNTKLDLALNIIFYLAIAAIGWPLANKLILPERNNALFRGRAKIEFEGHIERMNNPSKPHPHKPYLYRLNATLWIIASIAAAMTVYWKSAITRMEEEISTNHHSSGSSDDDATSDEITTINNDVILGVFSLLVTLLLGVTAMIISYRTRQLLRIPAPQENDGYVIATPLRQITSATGPIPGAGTGIALPLGQ